MPFFDSFQFLQDAYDLGYWIGEKFVTLTGSGDSGLIPANSPRGLWGSQSYRTNIYKGTQPGAIVYVDPVSGGFKVQNPAVVPNLPTGSLVTTDPVTKRRGVLNAAAVKRAIEGCPSAPQVPAAPPVTPAPAQGITPLVDAFTGLPVQQLVFGGASGGRYADLPPGPLRSPSIQTIGTLRIPDQFQSPGRRAFDDAYRQRREQMPDAPSIDPEGDAPAYDGPEAPRPPAQGMQQCCMPVMPCGCDRPSQRPAARPARPRKPRPPIQVHVTCCTKEGSSRVSMLNPNSRTGGGRRAPKMRTARKPRRRAARAPRSGGQEWPRQQREAARERAPRRARRPSNRRGANPTPAQQAARDRFAARSRAGEFRGARRRRTRS